jgi:hypothetical protein
VPGHGGAFSAGSCGTDGRLELGYSLGVADPENRDDERSDSPPYQHTWPFPGPDGEVVYPQRPTPSRVSKALRSEFAETLPVDMSAEEMHEAWHGWQAEHPDVWRSCHGALANRVEEVRFFDQFHDDRFRLTGKPEQAEDSSPQGVGD